MAAGSVLVLLAVLMLLRVTVSGMSSIAEQQRAPVISKWEHFDAQQQCLRDAIMHAVPQGARVGIIPNESEFLVLELAELTTPWATPVPNGDKADYTLKIESGTECGDESLVAEKSH